MLIAVEGCAHGELEKIYATIAHIEQTHQIKVDLLICCGDFESIRNVEDLSTKACPPKYRSMNTFHRYYSGELEAPILTLFIGGNHEASGYLVELPYGGWVAPKIFYLGYAGVVRFGGLRIAGLSGIFKGPDYARGHFEHPPFTEGTMRSVYHVRNLEVFRLKQLSPFVDIMLSHDWPRGVHAFGDAERLFRCKPFFRDEAESGQLGSRPSQELLAQLKPVYWFAAHMHVKFSALIPHEDGSSTKFLALDKCLPRRDFLQVLEMAAKPADAPLKLEYDCEWLAVLKSTNHLLCTTDSTVYLPGPASEQRWNFRPTLVELDAVRDAFDSNLEIPTNFCRTAPSFASGQPQLANRQLPLFVNAQTRDFCARLGVTDLNALFATAEATTENAAALPQAEFAEERVGSTNNPDEILLDDDDIDAMFAPDDDEDGEKSEAAVGQDVEPPWTAPAFVEGRHAVVDAPVAAEPSLKKFRRRNEAVYAAVEADSTVADD